MEDIGVFKLRRWFKIVTAFVLAAYALGFFRNYLELSIYGSLTWISLFGACGLALMVMLYKNWV